MKVVNLSKTYKTKSGEVKALEGLNFDLPESGIVFILGKSGSGKTTLLNLLSGLDNADDGGRIEVCGKDIVSCTESERDGYRNSCCGFVFQEYNLIPELNVSENIKLSCELNGEKDNDKRVADTLKLVELEGYGDRKVTELSGGQKQRVAIARAIVKEPKIVFADEPTGALDETTGESIFELLKNISQNKLVIVVSHDREFAEKYGDRIIELKDGKITSDSNSDYIENGRTEIRFKKPKLPFKTAAKIGCANFKTHPIRLVATILLSVIAFCFLGVALSLSLNRYENVVYNAMVADGVEYSALYKDRNGISEPITRDEAVVALGTDDFFGAVYADGVDISTSGDTAYDSIVPFAVAELSVEQVEKYGFTVTGRLPKQNDELCVTAFFADVLNRLEFSLPDYNGIVGAHVSMSGREYEIVGIADTRFDAAVYQRLKDTDEQRGALYEMYTVTLATSVHNLLFVGDIFEYAPNGYDYIVVENSPVVAKYIAGGDFKLNNYTVQSAGAYRVLIEQIQHAAWIVAAVFFVFAEVLLLNFLLQSFTDKLFSLGILKANGCKAVGLFKVFLCEAGVIAAAVLLFSSVATVVSGVCLNAQFGLAFFGSFYAVLPVLFASIVFVALSSCILPVIGIMRMTPMDVINKNV